jgi:hypothetical protein
MAMARIKVARIKMARIKMARIKTSVANSGYIGSHCWCQ